VTQVDRVYHQFSEKYDQEMAQWINALDLESRVPGSVSSLGAILSFVEFSCKAANPFITLWTILEKSHKLGTRLQVSVDSVLSPH